jgi:hypothetical protein
MLIKLQQLLTMVQDNDDLGPIFRIAAKAALLMLAKYHALLDECDIYTIAIGKYEIDSGASNPLITAFSNVP